MSIWKKAALWIAGIWVFLTLLVFVFQRKIQYFPDTDDVPAPGDGKTVTLTCADGTRIKATVIPGVRDAIVLVFHGNAGNRGHRIGLMRRLHRYGWSIFLLDYRGYGGSEGSPTEEGLGQDGDAAVAWIREHHPKDSIVFFGESIGGSVAVDVATRHKPDAMIFQNCAYEIVEVAKSHYPFLPVGLIMKDRWSSRGKIETLNVPMFFLHGTGDRIIPLAMGRALFDAAPGPKEWWEVERAHHNNLPSIAGVDWEKRINGFLSDTLNR